MKSSHIISNGKWIKFLWAALFCFMMSPTLSHALPGEKITSFSADQVVLSPDGKVLKTMKIYTTPRAFRLEMSTGGSQGMPRSKLIVLGFEKQNKQIIYNLDKKICFESIIAEVPMLVKLDSYENVDSAEIIGKEKVSGYPCVKKEVTQVVSMMGIEHSTKMTIWQSDKFDFPLRTQTVGGPIGEFRNIDTSVPPKKLFRRQTGYKRVHTLMEVMGMDFAAMAMKSEESDDEDSESNLNSDDNDGMSMEEVVAGVRQVVAEEDLSEEVKKILLRAANKSEQINMDKWASDGIWSVIPKHPGDKIGREIKTPHVYQVTMGTNASLNEIFDFYEKSLVPQGWEDKGRYIQDGMGTFTLWTEQHMLIIYWAENPGMDGNYEFFYSIKLSEIIK